MCTVAFRRRRTPYNLNAISHDAAERLVREVQGKDLHVSHVFVDTVGHPGAYQRRLTTSFGSKVQFTVEKKADAKFPVVSAASIAAKVTRDTGMEHWEFREPGWESQCACCSNRATHLSDDVAFQSNDPPRCHWQALLEAGTPAMR